MLILNPNSACDICLEGYNGSNIPHAIDCGHIFCLSCLQSLTRQCCPLCRTPFHPQDVRKLHIDRGTSQPPTPAPKHSTELDEYSSHSRELLTRITRIVHDGGRASDVRDLIEEVQSWLQTQSTEEHADLNAAYLLLYKYTDLKDRVRKKTADLAALTLECDELKEQIQAEKEATKDAEIQCEEQRRKRLEEKMAAEEVRADMEAQYNRMDLSWRGKYEVTLGECIRLNDQLERIKKGHSNPLPPLPRPVDSRFIYAMDKDSSAAEPMAIVKDDAPESIKTSKSETRGGEDMFALSPVPATIPIPSLTSRLTFRALTEDSDTEEVRNNPYLLRSIQPIPIKSNVHRKPSNPSPLSRHDTDPLPRSMPRGSLDIHMASCSSSPNVSGGFQYAPRERHSEMISSSTSMAHDSVLNRRAGDTRRSSVSSQMDTRDSTDEQRERWRAQLRDVLDTPQVEEAELTPNMDRGGETSRRSTSPYSITPESSNPVTRNPSPTLPAPNSQYSTSFPKSFLQPGSLQSSLLQRPQTLSRASTAAMQAERERARVHSLKESSTTSPTSTTYRPAATRDRPERERESIMPAPTSVSYQHPPVSMKPQFTRRQTTDSVRMRSATTSGTASALTRSLWQSNNFQEPQRV